MTREEAIRCLKLLKGVAILEQKEAIDMAIEALKAEPTGDLIGKGVYDQVRWERDEALATLERHGIGLGQAKPNSGDLISRQAAVEKILRNKDAKPLNESDFQDGIRAGLDIAYCEIRDMPSAEPVTSGYIADDKDAPPYETTTAVPEPVQPHGDLISREAAIEAIASHDTTNGNTVYFKGKTVIGYIKDLPSAEPVNGEWVHKDVVRNEDNTIEEWQEMECSVCGKWHTTPYAYYINEYNFCPNCGAKMGGKE